jgi:hypothetical protein
VHCGSDDDDGGWCRQEVSRSQVGGQSRVVAGCKNWAKVSLADDATECVFANSRSVGK